MLDLAIIVFTFKRSENVCRVLNLIKDVKYPIYVFHDYDGSSENLRLKNKLLNFDFIKLEVRNKNLGLKKNLIDGITHVTKKHRTFIVIEDDLHFDESILSDFICNFKKQHHSKEVFEISCFPITGLDEKNYPKILPVGTSWLWGSWSYNWNLFLLYLSSKQTLSFYEKLKIDFFFRYPFSYIYTLSENKSISSWAVYKHIYMIQNNLKCSYFFSPNFNFFEEDHLSTHGPNNFHVENMTDNWKRNLVIMSGNNRLINFLKYLYSCIN
jgi:hypothetical protein